MATLQGGACGEICCVAEPLWPPSFSRRTVGAPRVCPVAIAVDYATGGIVAVGLCAV